MNKEGKGTLSRVSKLLGLPESHPLRSKLTFGERSSDKISKWAGSWTFIIIFLIFLSFWMVINYAWINNWDPYPFILLNLILSTLAAIQAPIILMSQNRQSKKDRLRAEYDYAINRKSEKNIEMIVDRLTSIENELQTKFSQKKPSKSLN